MVGSDALGSRLSWRAHLAIVSTLAYRTLDNDQNFVDKGLGIGPQFPDDLGLGVSVGVPVGKSWLVAPDLTLFQQGEGRYDEPFPLGAALTATPQLFLGALESTWHLGVRASGGLGPFQFLGEGGWHHTTTRNRFVARIRATVGFQAQKALQ